jgi:hypothetical protein
MQSTERKVLNLIVVSLNFETERTFMLLLLQMMVTVMNLLFGYLDIVTVSISETKC